MVDARSIESRLERLDELLAGLEQIRGGGRASYDADPLLRLATQHGLQLAIQACLDIAGHLVAEAATTMPDEYRALFTTLAEDGLDSGLADRLRLAAGLRNILVHDYLDLDDEVVWEALDHLDDLRGFAAFAEEKLNP